MFNAARPKRPSVRPRLAGLAAAAIALAGIVPVGGVASAAEVHEHVFVAAGSQTAARQEPRSERTSQAASALRDLWVGHIFWVRNVSLAVLSKNDAAASAAEQRAVANAKAIAATLRPFYGAAAQESFFKLLGDHYGAVKDYAVATAARDERAQGVATQSLTANAEEIAGFLSKANPYLPKDTLHSLLVAHGGHHIQQIQQLQESDYTAEAAIWEAMKNHVYQIADATADALAKQFAEKF